MSVVWLTACQSLQNKSTNVCATITPESAENYSFENTRWTLYNSIDTKKVYWNDSVLEFTSQISERNKKKIEGTFTWYANGSYRGMEYFSGYFIAETGELNFHGDFIEDRKTINPSLYKAKLCNDGRTIALGTWEGHNTVSGKWSASLN